MLAFVHYIISKDCLRVVKGEKMNGSVIQEDYFIDLSGSRSAINLILKLGNLLEQEQEVYKNKKIKLNLGNTVLNGSNILSIKSLIENFDSSISIIYAGASQTQMAVLNAGLFVTDDVTELERKYEDKTLCGEDKISVNIKVEEITEKVDEEIKKIDFIKSKNLPTLYLQQTLRSGQSITFDGNVIIIGDCHPGSEIIASGDITVWGVLGGIGHAGAQGDEECKIRALKMNAIQLRIGGYFARRPDRMDVEKNNKTQAFIPEEAKILNGEIIISTLN